MLSAATTVGSTTSGGSLYVTMNTSTEGKNSSGNMTLRMRSGRSIWYHRLVTKMQPVTKLHASASQKGMLKK